MTLRILPSLAALCFATGSAFAQVAARPDSASQRTSTQEALADGRRAAEDRYVGGRLLGGALAGLPLGFSGSAMLFVGPDPQFVMGTVLGGGGLLLARAPGNIAPPDSLAALAAKEGPLYEQAWRAGYRERLSERRRRAADVGGTIGALIGIGFIAYIFLQPDYT